MISVICAYTKEFDALADVTMPILRAYCQKQDYDLTIHRGGFGNRDRQFGYQKTELVATILSRSDALFVVDADTLITNLHTKLESFLADDRGLFITKDENGINAGSYLIRNTALSQVFLRSVLGLEGAPSMLGEQDAMRWIFETGSFGHLVHFLPHPSINSYLYGEYGKIKTHEEGQWQSGDFLLHLPGMTNEHRIDIFKSLL